MTRPKYTPKTKTPPNPFAKKNFIAVRVSDEELKEIERRAKLYEAGHFSEYVRVALLNYEPKDGSDS